MRSRPALLVIVLAGLAVEQPARAQQPPPDPIGDILQGQTATPKPSPPPAQTRPAPPDPDEPDTAATGAQVEPEPSLPASPQPYVPRSYTPAPRRPALTGPVFLHETGKSPDAPPAAEDAAY